MFSHFIQKERNVGGKIPLVPSAFDPDFPFHPVLHCRGPFAREPFLGKLFDLFEESRGIAGQTAQLLHPRWDVGRMSSSGRCLRL